MSIVLDIIPLVRLADDPATEYVPFVGVLNFIMPTDITIATAIVIKTAKRNIGLLAISHPH